MDENNVEYYRQRAITSRRMAEAASEPYVAAIHLELARQYQALVNDKPLGPILSIVTSKGMKHGGVG